MSEVGRARPIDPTAVIASHRLVFVGGLHRSGTTPLVRWLERHPSVSGLSDTGVWEDEGQHLQDVYPVALEHGGPGRFAFDSGAHLTETSPLVTQGAAASLVASWAPHWDLERPVLIEKSPPNLIRTRFLAALFPDAHFLMMVRHPVATAYATQKWSRTPLDRLLSHWAVAHRRLLEDAPYVPRLAIVRYEDLMTAPVETMNAAFAHLELSPHVESWPVKGGLNDAYFARWEGSDPLKRLRARVLDRRHHAAAEAFGYSLRDLRAVGTPADSIARWMPRDPGTRA